MHDLKRMFLEAGLGWQVIFIAMLWALFWNWTALQDCITGPTERYLTVYKRRERAYTWLIRSGWITAFTTFIVMLVRA